MALFEDLQVLGYRGKGDVEWCSEGGDGKGSVAEPVQDCAARGVAESVKEAVDINFTVDLGFGLWTYFRAGHSWDPFRRWPTIATVPLPIYRSGCAIRPRGSAGRRRLR